MPTVKAWKIIGTSILLVTVCQLLPRGAMAVEKLPAGPRPFAISLCNMTRDPITDPFFCNGFASSSGEAPIPAGTRFTIQRIAGICAPDGYREIGGVFGGRQIYYPFAGGGSLSEPFSVETLMFVDSNAPLGPGGWDVLVQSTDGNCRVVLTGYVSPLP